MNVRRNSGVGAVFLALGVTVTIAEDSDVDNPRYESVPLVHYVLPTKDFPHTSSYYGKIRSGRLEYDDEFRLPSTPPNYTDVDCGKATKVGVTYLLKGRKRFRSERIRVRYVWEHETADVNDASSDHYHGAFFGRGQSATLLSESIILTDQVRVDGILSLTASIRGETILNASFLLTGCSK